MPSRRSTYESFGRVRFSQLLPIMLQPNNKNNKHDDKTTKAYSSNTMGDGPERKEVERKEILIKEKPLDYSKNAANEIQTRVIARIVKDSKRGSGNSNVNRKIYSDNEGKVKLFCFCKAHQEEALEFFIDPNNNSIAPRFCYSCLDEERKIYPLKTDEEIIEMIGSQQEIKVFIEHTNPRNYSRKIIHLVGEGTPRELEGKIITQDPVLSCLTCKEHKEYYNQKRQQDRIAKREQITQEAKELEDNAPKSIERKIRAIFDQVEKQEEHIFFFNGDFIPEIDGAIFEEPEEANDKLVQKLRNNVKALEFASKLSILFYQLCRSITKKEPSEENLMKIWHILADCKNEENSLRESGMGSIFLDQMIDPVIQTIMNECSNEMKRELRGSKKPRIFPTIKLPLYPESSSRSASSSSSNSFISSASSTISSGSSSSSRRMEPPPMPPPLPPPMPKAKPRPSEVLNIHHENLERESMIQLQKLIVKNINDNLVQERRDNEEICDDEDSLMPIRSPSLVPEQIQSPLPNLGMDEDEDLEALYNLFQNDDQPLPNPL